jgi:hypothetical protein
MSPIGTPVPGAFPLTSADKLPNVTIAYPGERWSDRKASGQIIPGVAVVPIASAGKLLMRPAVGGDAATQMAVATRSGRTRSATCRSRTATTCSRCTRAR